MDLLEGLKWLAKICTRHPGCRNCPLYTDNACPIGAESYPTAAAKIIEDYAAAHPPKTYKDVFLEAFPRAETVGGTPRACREFIFGEDISCYHNIECQDCWNQPYEEDTNENK